MIELIIPEGKDWIDLLSSLLTPIIAIAVASIAFCQWRTAEEHRKQLLFDKRYRFFKMLWSMYSSHIEDPRSNRPVDVTDLLDYVHEAEFLFGQDIVDHMMSIEAKQQENCLNYDWFSKPFKRYLTLK